MSDTDHIPEFMLTARNRLEHAYSRILLRNQNRAQGFLATAWSHTQRACELLQEARDLMSAGLKQEFEKREHVSTAFALLIPQDLARLLSLYLMVYELRGFPEQIPAAEREAS